jgi:hypothetical protein
MMAAATLGQRRDTMIHTSNSGDRVAISCKILECLPGFLGFVPGGAVANACQKFDSDHPPTCDPNSGQSMPPVANDRATVAKIADLDQ